MQSRSKNPNVFLGTNLLKIKYIKNNSVLQSQSEQNSKMEHRVSGVICYFIATGFSAGGHLSLHRRQQEVVSTKITK